MNFSRFYIYIFRIILLISLLLILHLSTVPIDTPLIINDKLSHLFTFYVLALLIDFSFPNSSYHVHKIIPLLGYGIIIETSQFYLPYRSFSLVDFAADATGLVVYGISLPLIKRFPLLKQRWKSD